jgi:excisionase family DNA binding protein
MLTVREIAAELGYARVEPILKLIASGSLRAIDTSTKPGRRTWRVREEDFENWKLSRTYIPTPTPTRRPRRNPTVEKIPSYV